MNTTDKIHSAAKASTLRLLRRTASAGIVIAVVAAAIAVPVTAPEPTADSAPMVIAIARADCPPDCGPGGGGTPSGPPGGGTEFVPPSMPAMPSYEPGRGQPPLDQNNGISIYNSAAPQPSQAAQPSQAPIQNQDGTYNRAANGEQQPINHNAPNNQQLNSDWQKLSDQLNPNQTGQQPGQHSSSEERSDQSDDSEKTLKRVACDGTFSSGGGFSGECTCKKDQQEPIRTIQAMLDQSRVDKWREIDGLQRKADSLSQQLKSDQDALAHADPYKPGELPGLQDSVQKDQQLMDTAEGALRDKLKEFFAIPDYSNLKDITYTVPSGNPDKGDPVFRSPSIPQNQAWWSLVVDFGRPAGSQPMPESMPSLGITNTANDYYVDDLWNNLQFIFNNGKYVGSQAIPKFGWAPGETARVVNKYLVDRTVDVAWFVFTMPSAPEEATVAAIFRWLIEEKSQDLLKDDMRDLLEKLGSAEQSKGEKRTKTVGDLLANTARRSADQAGERLAQHDSVC